MLDWTRYLSGEQSIYCGTNDEIMSFLREAEEADVSHLPPSKLKYRVCASFRVDREGRPRCAGKRGWYVELGFVKEEITFSEFLASKTISFDDSQFCTMLSGMECET